MNKTDLDSLIVMKLLNLLKFGGLGFRSISELLYQAPRGNCVSNKLGHVTAIGS